MKKTNKKPIPFSLSTDFCLAKALENFEGGDFVMSLSYLQRVENRKMAKSQYREFCMLHSQISHVFGTEAGNFWAMKYITKNGFDSEMCDLIAYATIENDYELLGRKQNDMPDFLKGFMDVLSGEEDGNFDLASLGIAKTPKRDLKFTADMIAENAIAEGDKFVKNMDFEGAIVHFRKVENNSKLYLDALSKIGLCHLFIGNYKKCYEINKIVLSADELFLQSILQMLSVCSILEKQQEFEEFLAVAKKINIPPLDSIKMANILIDAKKYELALPYFEFAFDSLNYSLEGYATYILTMYNAGKTDRAKREMKEILKFFPQNGVLWYLLSEMTRGSGETLSYQPLFSTVFEPIVKLGLKVLKSAKLYGKDAKGFEKEVFFSGGKKLAYAKYALANSSEAVEYFDLLIGGKKGKELLCDMLFDGETVPQQRVNILRYLMKNRVKGKVLFRGDEFRYLTLSYPKCVEQSEVMFMAYAFAFSQLAEIACGFETSLKLATKSFFDACAKKQVAYESLFPADFIAGIIAVKSGEIEVSEGCKIFKLEEKKLLYVGKLLFGNRFGE